MTVLAIPDIVVLGAVDVGVETIGIHVDISHEIA
jgi:hypothetical protein